MKDYEALELQAKAMRLVEGTDLNWKDVIRLHSEVIYSGLFDLNGYKPRECELAFAIVEGKPVWLPPKPKTVLVELLAEMERSNDVRYRWDAGKSKIAELEKEIEQHRIEAQKKIIAEAVQAIYATEADVTLFLKGIRADALEGAAEKYDTSQATLLPSTHEVADSLRGMAKELRGEQVPY
jgi:hypothetical protein